MNEQSPVKVQAINLSKNFGDLRVLDDLSFSIQKGELVCIVGPTGCGKTTILNILTKLLEPTSGQLLIDGEPADPRKHDLAFVFQEPSIFPWLNVEQNIAFGLKMKNFPKAEIKERTNKILKLMGMEEYRNTLPKELSVSSEQRVIIGRAFAMNPDLLLMDEPYGQMDIKMRYYLEEEVLRLWKELGTTIIFITHNIEEAVFLAQRLIILSNKPTKIKENFIVDLPRPRRPDDPDFIELRKYVVEQIKWW
jgi:ABC-type nitrate/sulfonate/bicarbonate transport system ATPase subunit